MKAEIGTFSTGSTGHVSVTGLTVLPVYLKFTLSGRFNTTETIVQFSTGFTEGTKNKAHSIFQDSTGSRSKAYSDRCINHFQRVAGTITEQIVATWVSFDTNGGGDFGFTLNFTAADSNYQIYFEAYS